MKSYAKLALIPVIFQEWTISEFPYMYECVRRMLHDLFVRTEHEMWDELPEGFDTAMASR